MATITPADGNHRTMAAHLHVAMAPVKSTYFDISQQMLDLEKALAQQASQVLAHTHTHTHTWS